MSSPVPSPGRSALDIVVMRGFLWTSGGRLVVQLATWVISLVIARLLTPRDYGIATMASLYVGFAQLLAELGIGAAIVQRPNLTKEITASLMGVSLLTGILLAIVSVPAGYGLSEFYREPILLLVVSVYGINFIPTAFRSVSAALLSRQMAFHKVTLLTLVEAVVASLTSLVLALAGWSVWSLVLGNMAAVCVAAILGVTWAYPGMSFRFGPLRQSGALTFGYKILVSRAAWYFYASTDFLIIGRLIGAQSLGHYNLAYQFASVPADRVTGALTQVLFPVLSSLQRDAGELARYFKNALEACVLVLLPAYIGLALVAHDLIAVALGPKWQDAAAILALLSLAAVVRSVISVANTVVVSAGNAGVPAKLSLVGLLVFPPAFYFGVQWGAAGVAAVWLALYGPVIGVPTFAVALRATSLGVHDLIALTRPYLLATMLMAAAVSLVRGLLIDAPGLVRLSAAVASGVVVYGAVLLIFCRPRVLKYVNLASRALSPTKDVTASPTPVPASEPSC